MLGTITTAFRDFKVALRISTQKLTRDERREAIPLSEIFVERLKIEEIADRHGWDVPPYPSPEWDVMRAAFEGEV